MNQSEPVPGTPLQKNCHSVEAVIPVLNVSRPQRRGLRPFGTSGLAIILGGTILLGCFGKSPDKGDERAAGKGIAPAVVLVSIRNLQFSPMTIEVRKGDMVEWQNEDLVPHTATSTSFDSGTLLSGQSWRHTFMDAGSFSYVCTFHPQMKGAVIVK